MALLAEAAHTQQMCHEGLSNNAPRASAESTCLSPMHSSCGPTHHTHVQSPGRGVPDTCVLALSPHGSCCMHSSLQPSRVQLSTHAATSSTAPLEQSCALTQNVCGHDRLKPATLFKAGLCTLFLLGMLSRSMMRSDARLYTLPAGMPGADLSDGAHRRRWAWGACE